jgi:hypothetical protein
VVAAIANYNRRPAASQVRRNMEWTKGIYERQI